MLAVDTQITHLLTPGSVCVGLKGSTKAEILSALIDLVAGNPAVESLDTVRNDVLEREALMSTGVGQGLALPHAKTSGVRETIAAFAVSKSPIDFGSIDGLPVRLFFLLLGPETAGSQHIKVLSRISRLMNRSRTREALMAAKTVDGVLEILEKAEAQLLDR